MNVNLTKPCKNCPFNKVGAIELRPGRVEGIIAGLLKDDHQNFVCHKTLHIKKPASMCAGAMVYLMKVGRPSVSMRMAFAMKLLDPKVLTAQVGTVIDPPSTTKG